MEQMPGGCALDSMEVAMQTEGYSGADVVLIAKEAAMRPLRRLMSRIEANQVDPDAELSTGPITAEDISEVPCPQHSSPRPRFHALLLSPNLLSLRRP